MKTASECLAFNVRYRRKQMKLSLERLAESANLSAKFIQQIESRRRWPSPETLKKLARALKTTEPMLFLDPEMDFSLADLAAVLDRIAKKQQR